MGAGCMELGPDDFITIFFPLISRLKLFHKFWSKSLEFFFHTGFPKLCSQFYLELRHHDRENFLISKSEGDSTKIPKIPANKKS